MGGKNGIENSVYFNLFFQREKIDKNDKKTLIDYAKNQYVCPTCFKPLFPKSIYSNYSKPHFSHYEREEVETNCPNRRDSKNKNNSKKYLRDKGKYYSY